MLASLYWKRLLQINPHYVSMQLELTCAVVAASVVAASVVVAPAVVPPVAPAAVVAASVVAASVVVAPAERPCSEPDRRGRPTSSAGSAAAAVATGAPARLPVAGAGPRPARSVANSPRSSASCSWRPVRRWRKAAASPSSEEAEVAARGGRDAWWLASREQSASRRSRSRASARRCRRRRSNAGERTLGGEARGGGNSAFDPMVDCLAEPASQRARGPTNRLEPIEA